MNIVKCIVSFHLILSILKKKYKLIKLQTVPGGLTNHQKASMLGTAFLVVSISNLKKNYS